MPLRVDCCQSGLFWPLSSLAAHRLLTIPYCGVHSPVRFTVVRTLFDANEHALAPRPDFVTPDILKYHPLAGVTMVLPRPDAGACVVAMRRYRREGGFIVFRVSAGSTGVDVRQMVLKRDAPRTLAVAEAGIEWDAMGGYAGNVTGTVPRDGSFYDVETMSADELREATVSASEAEFPTLLPVGATVVTITPGVVRVTCLDAANDMGESMRARMIRCEGFMTTGEYGADPEHPLQMIVRGGFATAFPIADHDDARSLLGTALV
jgi:hypothetical protein